MILKILYDAIVKTDPRHIRHYIESAAVPRYVNAIGDICDVVAVSRGLRGTVGLSDSEYRDNIQLLIGTCTGRMYHQLQQRKDFATGSIWDISFRDDAYNGWWETRVQILPDLGICCWEGVLSRVEVAEQIKLVA